MANSKLNTTLHTHLLSVSTSAAGFSASDVTGYSPEQVRRAAEAMVHANLIIRWSVSPRRIRYFANEALAKAFTANRTSAAAASRMTLGTRTKAPWKVEDPGVITPATKIYIAPPLPRRVFRTNTYSLF